MMNQISQGARGNDTGLWRGAMARGYDEGYGTGLCNVGLILSSNMGSKRWSPSVDITLGYRHGVTTRGSTMGYHTQGYNIMNTTIKPMDRVQGKTPPHPHIMCQGVVTWGFCDINFNYCSYLYLKKWCELIVVGFNRHGMHTDKESNYFQILNLSNSSHHLRVNL